MIHIGITGHRNLNQKFITNYEQSINLKLLTLKKEYSSIVIYSSLADGADRLIINEALKLDIEYIVILPMPQEKYSTDFNTMSKIKLNFFVKKAKSIITMPTQSNNQFSRDRQYELAGHYISDNCNILFALWDGKESYLKGGTSEIVKYHRLKKKKILYHIKVIRE